MLTRAATLSAQQAGFEVAWLCSSAFSSELDQSGATIAPVFGASMYDAYLPNAASPEIKMARLGQRLKKLLGASSPPPPEAPAHGKFYADLCSAIAQHSISADDRILLHTGDGESLQAVVQFVQETPSEGLPIIHMATPYDPAGVMPNKAGMENFPARLAELKAIGKLGSKLFLYAENALLAEHLSGLWDVTVRPLPLPVSDTTDRTAAAKAQLCDRLNLPADAFVIVSLGAARIEKGFHLMPDIARRVFELADDKTAQRIKFVLHASPQIIGRDPVIAKAISALEDRPDGQIFLQLDALSDADYQTLLHASDVVLMPYGEREYRVRGSAVVTEAISAGKTIVARPNTYPGAAAEQHGGRTGDAPIDMAKAIIDIAQNREAFVARAASERVMYNEENAVENYWRRCLKAENSA